MNNLPPNQTSPDLCDTPQDCSMWPPGRSKAWHTSDETPFVPLPSDPAFVRLCQYEWVSCGTLKNYLLLGWVQSPRGLLLIDDSGKRLIVYDCTAVVMRSIDYLPVCWLQVPDVSSAQQAPVPPQPFETKAFLKTVECWRDTVTNCLDLFADNDVEVDYMMYGRLVLQKYSTQHPAYKLLPEWNLVLALDQQLCDCAAQMWPVEPDGSLAEWLQLFPVGWHRAGWLIYAAIDRDLSATTRGVALAKKHSE